MPRGRTSRPRRRSHMPRFRPRAVREARRAARARACADRSEAALSTAPGPRVGERLRATRRQQPAKRPGLRRYRFVSIRVRTIRRRACAAFLSSRLLASFGQAWPHYLAPVIVKLEMQRSVASTLTRRLVAEPTTGRPCARSAVQRDWRHCVRLDGAMSSPRFADCTPWPTLTAMDS